MAAPNGYRPLRLVAEDADDINVVSACLQDAILKVGDVAYAPSARRFAFVANRFAWEIVGDKKRGPFWRVRTGAHFDDVLAVRQQNIRLDAKDAVLELLSVRFEAGKDGGGAVILDFSGGGAIRLEVEAINAEMRDLSGPWTAMRKPEHDL